MIQENIKKIIKKYLRGKATKEEINLIESFENFAEKKIKNKIFENQSEKTQVRKVIFKNIEVSIKKKTNYRVWIKIAASIALIISIGVGYYFIFPNTNNTTVIPKAAFITKKTPFGQKLVITLSDGSMVKLNSGSTITFPAKFTDSTRPITLEGEAYFDVVKNKNKPFIITSNKLITTVLGTTFNVEAYASDSNIKVTLATGKVSIDANGKTTLLTPSEQAVFNKKNRQITTQKVQIQKYLEWKDGILRFENTTLGDAVKKLEKWYNVAIEFENKNLSKCVFTGTFKNERLKTILEHIAFVKQNIHYEFISERRIILKGKCRN